MKASEIALYSALTKLGLKYDEAKEAVADVASSKDVATKIDIIELKAETKADIKDMATKADIAEVKSDITEVKSDITEVKSDITEVKTDIREIRIELKYLRWLIVIVVSIAVGVIKYL